VVWVGDKPTLTHFIITHEISLITAHGIIPKECSRLLNVLTGVYGTG